MGETRQRKHDSKSGPEKDKAKDKDHTEKNGKKQQVDETKKGKKVNLLAFRKEWVIEIDFSYFLTTTYVVVSHKNSLNEMVLLSSPNMCLY